jgi:hypothetical protein
MVPPGLEMVIPEAAPPVIPTLHGSATAAPSVGARRAYFILRYASPFETLTGSSDR